MKGHPIEFVARLGAAAALIIGLTACSVLPSLNLRDTIARIAATPVRLDSGPTPTVAPPDVSTAALAKARSKLRVGIRFDAPPLASVDDSGNLVGLDVDIAREFARRWLGSTNNVEFVQVTSNSAPRLVQNREVDMALGGLVHTRPAETDADFSLPYLEDGDALLIRTGSFADFPSLATRNVTYVDLPATTALGEAQIASNITVTVQSAPSYEQAYADLREGRTDGVVGRWRRLRLEAQRDPALSVLTVFNRQPVAVMLPQNDSDWADLVNSTLSGMVAEGWFDAAHQNWFGAPPPAIATLPGPIDLQLAALPDTTAPGKAFDRVRADKVARVGFNAQSDPMATLDANGQPIGFEVDLVRELAQRWFQDPGAAQFTALPAGQFAAGFEDGTIDLAVGDIAQTQGNERPMDFSLPIYQSGLSFAVVNGSGATDLASLNGKRIGYVQETTDTAALEAALRARGVTFTSTPFPDLASAVATLRAGQIDAVTADRVTLLALARAASDIAVLPERVNPVPIAIALPRNDSAMRDLVNLTLQQMVSDGAYARIYRAWFNEEPPAIELWSGEATRDTALIAPTPTPLPSPTPVIVTIEAPTPEATPAPAP